MPDAAALRREALKRLAAVWPAFAAATALLGLESALAIAASLLAAPLFDRGLLAGDAALVARVCAAQALLYTAAAAAGAGRGLLYARAGSAAARALGAELYESLQAQGLRFFTAARPAEIHQRVYGDVQCLEGAFGQAAGGALVAAAKLALVGGFMVRRDPALAGVALAALALVATLSSASARADRALLEASLKRAAALSAHVLRTLSAPGRVLAATSGTGALERERFASLSAALGDVGVRRQARAGAAGQAIGLVIGGLGLAVLAAGARRTAAGRLSVGELMAFAALAGWLSGPAAQLAGAAGYFGEAALRLRRALEYRDRAPEVPRAAAPRRVIRGPRRLTLEDVRFRWDPAAPLLEGVSLALEPGKVVALAGRSGAGKSTLAYLAMRLLDPQGGRVALDGADVRGLDLDGYRRQFAYVGQDPLLFGGTLRENLSGAAPRGDRELAEACGRVLLGPRLARLPRGFDTELGEGGLGLSGGERQRLALARALLRRTPFCVLDEPTAFLDRESERAFAAALADLRRDGAAVLLVSHGADVLRLADEVVPIGARAFC